MAPPGKPAVEHRVGEQETLFIYNAETQSSEEVEFTYRAINEHSAILVANDVWSTTVSESTVSAEDVERLSEIFEDNVGPGAGLGVGAYDLITTHYGASVTPVLGDSMVYIAIADINGNVQGEAFIAGYVNRNDFTTNPQSNRRDLIVIDAVRATDAIREETLTHEFFHLIHYGLDPHEDLWIDEGMAVYTQTICGYPGNDGSHYFDNPEIGFGNNVDFLTLAQYDKAYLIMQFMADHFGEALIGEIARQQNVGIGAIDLALGKLGRSEKFITDVFPAWTIANLRPPDRDSPYSYETYDPLAHQPVDFGVVAPLPIRESGSLDPYGVMYFRRQTVVRRAK